MEVVGLDLYSNTMHLSSRSVPALPRDRYFYPQYNDNVPVSGLSKVGPQWGQSHQFVSTQILLLVAAWTKKYIPSFLVVTLSCSLQTLLQGRNV